MTSESIKQQGEPFENSRNEPESESVEKQGKPFENSENEPKYDAILVLGACMEWNEDRKQWQFPTWVSKDIYGPELVMGKARAIAASSLSNKTETILVTGGMQKNPVTEEEVSRATELSRVIKERGVPADKIIPIGKGGNTLKNAEDTAEYLKANPEIIQNKRIAVLSPRFQSDRARMMFEQNTYFQENDISVDWIIVEDVLEGRDERYKKWVQAVYEDPRYDTVLESEAEGIKDLKSGRYKPKQ